MRYLIVSDIHGIVENLPVIKEKAEDCDKLIVLGDIYYADYYHRLSPNYNPEYVEGFLKQEKNKIICVRGNCDSGEVVKNSTFPIHEELVQITNSPLEVFATHGHIYNEKNWDKENTILLFGHYHIPFIQKKNNCIFVNPGSISLPKGAEKPSYAILTDQDITIYDIDGMILNQIQI